MGDDLRRGQQELVAIIAVGAAGFLLIGLAGWLRGGEVNWIAALGRPVVLVGLGGLAWEGRKWARTATVVWMAVIGLIVLINALQLLGVNSTAAAMFLAFGLVFMAAAYYLRKSPHIEAFLASRQRRRDGATDSPPAA